MSQENVEIVRRSSTPGTAGTRRRCWRSSTPRSSTSTPRRQSSRERGTVRARPLAVVRTQWEFLRDGRTEIDRTYDRGEEVLALGRVFRLMPEGETRIEDRVLNSVVLRDGKIMRVEVLGFGGAEARPLKPPGCRSRRCRRRTSRSCSVQSRLSMPRCRCGSELLFRRRGAAGFGERARPGHHREGNRGHP